MTTKEYLYFLVASLVEHKDSIEIDEKHDELGTLLTLKVDQKDMWSIIGRGWKTIDSLRTVLRVYWSRSWSRVNLRILEDTVV